MLFADVLLANRIERVEAALLRDATDRVAARLPAGQAFCEAVAGGTAAFTEPGSPLNKIFGVGFAGPIDDAALTRLERVYAAHSTPTRIEVSSLADPAIAAALTRRGYALVAVENVLGMALPARGLPARPADLTLRESPAGEVEEWLDVIVGGFASPDVEGAGPPEVFESELLRRIVRDFAQAPGVLRLLARRDGQPAGGASMRMADGIALLCGAATLPVHRRRGVQTALLAERLAMASETGCELAVITTQPGSKSMQNAVRRGFELLYVRTVLVRDA